MLDVDVDKLALDHWRYVCRVLQAHHVDQNSIEVAGFHYVEAFKHGYKHALEDIDDILCSIEQQPEHDENVPMNLYMKKQKH